MRIRVIRFSMAVAAGLMCAAALQSCGSGDSRLPHRRYERAEIFWQRSAPWGILRLRLYDVDAMLAGDTLLRPCMTELRDRATMRYLSGRISGAEYESGRGGSGNDAVIVLLLHHRDGVDTLSTNARPEFGLRFNGVTFRDSLLVEQMIDIVSDFDSQWKTSRDTLCYDGRYNALPASRMKRHNQSQVEHIERPGSMMQIQDYDMLTVYYMDSPEWDKIYVSPVSTGWYFLQPDRLGLYASSFTITRSDTLSYIIERLRKAKMSSSSPKNYHVPNIIILMRNHADGVTDTLSVKGNYISPLQFNSFEFYDSGLDAFLTETVLRRSPEWRSLLGYAPEFYRKRYIPEEYRTGEDK